MKKHLLTFALLCWVMAAMAQPAFDMPRVEPDYKDVNYAADELEAHRMDVYLPKTEQERYPVVVAVYGSAWFANNMKGAAYFSVGKPLVDAVVDWFGPVDMARMENCETVKDANSPEAALIGGAPADNPDMIALISPISYVDDACVPFLVIHGDADNVVPHCQSVYFAEALGAAGCLDDFITVPGGQHGPVTFNEDTYKRMTDFFTKCRNKAVERDCNSCKRK